jgi:mannose-6-phosphate isomerase-like protein (cupin superfamily)
MSTTDTEAVPQRFSISRAEGATYTGGGLRDFFTYRDLGIAAASNGKAVAQIIKAMDVNDETKVWHFHTLELQFFIVLSGTVTAEFEGEGTFELRVGDCVLQPPGIRHRLHRWSADMEILEVSLPADYQTTSVIDAPT